MEYIDMDESDELVPLVSDATMKFLERTYGVQIRDKLLIPRADYVRLCNRYPSNVVSARMVT